MKILICGVSLMGLWSCQSFKANMDLNGLDDYARSLEAELQVHPPRVSAQPLPDVGSRGLHSPVPAELPLDLPLERRPLQRWKLSVPHMNVVGELLSFPPVGGASLGPSYFYYFHPEGKPFTKAILWAPGFGVSDLAFLFIKRFFRTELESGWAVLVWVPPFHLERRIPGKAPGAGLISPDLNILVANMNAALEELHRGYGWLKSQGYGRIGAWGGSFGAANLLRLAQDVDLDHLAVMIPLLDWNTIWASRPFTEIRREFQAAGIGSAQVESMLASISPRYARGPNIPPERIAFLIADYDQLTPLDITNGYMQGFAKPDGLKPVVWYFKESHSTILMNGAVYRAYGEFLRSMR